MQILIVDDSAIIRKILKSVLSQLRLTEVSEAVHGQEALVLMRRRKPDLVFLDLNMPVMDGLSFLQVLGGPDNAPPVPVVVVSSDTDADRRAEAMRLGAKTYVTKPFNLEGLKRAMAVACPAFVPPGEAEKTETG
jgi:CheY-like chemotaxis protein